MGTDAIRVLLVESRPTVADILMEELTLAGYKVGLFPNNCLLTQEVIETQKPHILIVRFDTPAADCDTVRWFWQITAGQVGIIAIGGVWGAEISILALRSGADYYLPEPYGMNELLAQLRALVRRLRV